MGLIRNVLVFVAVVSFFTFVAFFGQLPALRKTPVGLMHRVIWVHIPHAFKQLDQTLFSGRFTEHGRRLGHYLFQEQNPVVLIFYLGIVTSSAVLFLWNALHLLPWRLIYPIPIILGMPYYFTYASVVHTAHYITAENHESRMLDYPFDHVLYHPNNHCSTCLREKPARSKHCSLCGVCVAKCDHHCPWVNNCLGRGNYGYFLALLLCLSVCEVYGAYLCYYLLQPHLKSTPPQPSIWSTIGVKLSTAALQGGLSITGVGLLAAGTAALPFGLFCYHAYLVWAGMTTNESQKWADWRADMDDGLVFKATRSAVEAHNRERRQNSDAPETDTEMANPILSLGLHDQQRPKAWWPVDSDQVLVQTYDGKPPQGQDGLWKRVWSLQDVDNIYDLGTWDNVGDIIRSR